MSRVILTKAATLKSFAVVFRTPATCVIKDMPAGAGGCGCELNRNSVLQRKRYRHQGDYRVDACHIMTVALESLMQTLEN